MAASPLSGAGLSRSGAHALSMTAPGAAAALAAASPSVEAPPLHKDRGQNGIEGHAAAALAVAGASPAALLPNGESDAMNALNLSVPRAEARGGQLPGATPPSDGAGVSSGWHVPVVTTTTTTTSLPPAPTRTRSVRLIAGFAGLVVICVAVLYSFVLVKKPAPPVERPKVSAEPAPAPKEAPAARAEGAAPEAKATAKEASPSGPSATVAGRVPPAKATGIAAKKPSRGGARPTAPSTEPAPFDPSLTSDQAATAARFSDTPRRIVPLRGGGGAGAASAARVTPDQADITRVVKNNKGGINICYQRALLRDNSLTHGKVDVDISVGISGKVKKVTIDGPAAFRVLEPCIRDVIGRWVFPPSSDEYNTQFSSSFVGSE